MITAIIVENEERAAIALSQLLKIHCPEVRVEAICYSYEVAFATISVKVPDILFLDIELDGGKNAFDLLKEIKNPLFEIIFTTAYDQYTLQAIKNSCLEYLMKPINSDELVEAIQKYNKRKNFLFLRQQLDTLKHNISNIRSQGRITIPTSDGYVFINLHDIICCQAEANYTMIYTLQGEKIVCSKNIGYIEDLLVGDNFFRIHKSYLVNLDHAKKLEKKDGYQLIMHGSITAEVSQRNKDELLRKMR